VGNAEKEDLALNMREKADSLVRETQDMRWQAARDTIQKALEEQYRVGLLDGEAQAETLEKGTGEELFAARDRVRSEIEGAAV
jgi:hypothetical protein